LGFPGAETLFHAQPIRGYAYWDFATGEYKGTCPWVSRVPKCETIHASTDSGFRISRFCDWRISRELALGFPGCRNTETYLRSVDSGFRISGFHDWRIQGNLPFGFPGAKMKHSRSRFRISGFTWRIQGNLRFPGHRIYAHIRISRLANTRELALGFPRCRNTETYLCSVDSGFRISGFRD
jgi:hypothetical protein